LGTCPRHRVIEKNHLFHTTNRPGRGTRVHSRATKYLKAGIGAALDKVAPLTVVKVRKGKSLYLARDTLELMKLRDHVAKGRRYRKLRNRCLVLVERAKRNSNQSKLTKSKDDPRVLW
jgi:hypothetical protein